MSDADDLRRAKLDTTIEREIHKFVKAMSESVYDTIQMYVRKSDIPVDMGILDHILKTTQVAMTSYEIQNIDKFHGAIKADLDGYVGEENPTESPRRGKSIQLK